MTTLEAGNAADRAKLLSVLRAASKKGAKRRSKYNNKIVLLDGRKFHSQGEANRYLILKQMEDEGQISDLKCQWGYDLYAWGPSGKIKVGRYVADFVYVDNKTGKEITEDFKGCTTANYLLKKKIIAANYSIDIKEVKAR